MEGVEDVGQNRQGGSGETPGAALIAHGEGGGVWGDMAVGVFN